MIDIENEIFTMLKTRLSSEFPGIFVTGEYVAAPPKFPAVSIQEVENDVYRRSQDSGSMENHDMITYEVNVYSNKTSGKKTECKAIAKIIDYELLQKGFTRHMLFPVPNVNDASIYRITGRWMCIVSKDKMIYRR